MPEHYEENPAPIHPRGTALGMVKQNSFGGCTTNLKTLSHLCKTEFAATCCLAERCDQGGAGYEYVV